MLRICAPGRHRGCGRRGRLHLPVLYNAAHDSGQVCGAQGVGQQHLHAGPTTSPLHRPPLRRLFHGWSRWTNRLLARAAAIFDYPAPTRALPVAFVPSSQSCGCRRQCHHSAVPKVVCACCTSPANHSKQPISTIKHTLDYRYSPSPAPAYTTMRFCIWP